MDKIDMSLDDIIKQEKRQRGRGRGGYSGKVRGTPTSTRLKSFRGRVGGKQFGNLHKGIGVSPLNRNQQQSNGGYGQFRQVGRGRGRGRGGGIQGIQSRGRGHGRGGQGRGRYTGYHYQQLSQMTPKAQQRQAQKAVQFARRTLGKQRQRLARQQKFTQARGLQQGKSQNQWTQGNQGLGGMRSDQIVFQQKKKRRWGRTNAVTTPNAPVMTISVPNVTLPNNDVKITLSKQQRQQVKIQQDDSLITNNRGRGRGRGRGLDTKKVISQQFEEEEDQEEEEVVYTPQSRGRGRGRGLLAYSNEYLLSYSQGRGRGRGKARQSQSEPVVGQRKKTQQRQQHWQQNQTQGLQQTMKTQKRKKKPKNLKNLFLKQSVQNYIPEGNSNVIFQPSDFANDRTGVSLSERFRKQTSSPQQNQGNNQGQPKGRSRGNRGRRGGFGRGQGPTDRMVFL